MNYTAHSLFETLRNFKHNATNNRSPQQLLIDYCNQVLGAVERSNVDFKQKQNRQDATLSDSDKRNLAKAVSGFANSAGGVLIWGIEDESLTPKPISDVAQFTASLSQLAAQVTDPVVRNIDVDWLPADGDNDRCGFVLLYIPESDLPPHRVILNNREVKNHYYIRSGESFVVATHTQLEDMLGRRPKPLLSLAARFDPPTSSGKVPNARYYLNVVLGIRNEGRGPAQAPFLAVKVREPYSVSRHGLDGNGNIGLQRLTVSPGTDEHQYGASADVVIHAGVVHDVTAIAIEMNSERIREMPDLVIDWRIVAIGIQPVVGSTTLTFIDFYNAIENAMRQGQITFRN